MLELYIKFSVNRPNMSITFKIRREGPEYKTIPLYVRLFVRLHLFHKGDYLHKSLVLSPDLLRRGIKRTFTSSRPTQLPLFLFSIVSKIGRFRLIEYVNVVLTLESHPWAFLFN